MHLPRPVGVSLCEAEDKSFLFSHFDPEFCFDSMRQGGDSPATKRPEASIRTANMNVSLHLEVDSERIQHSYGEPKKSRSWPATTGTSQTVHEWLGTVYFFFISNK